MNTQTNPDDTEVKDLNIIRLKKGETVEMSKALGSSKRLEILRQLIKEELNLSQIADKVKSTPQAVHHHLRILSDSQLVRVVREETIKNMKKTIKYYRANYNPDGINLISWDPFNDMALSDLKSRIPIQEKPVERIVRKIAKNFFKDVTETKIEILTSIVKHIVDLSHETMGSLYEDYKLELDDKLWNLILLFTNLSVINAIKKLLETEDYKKDVDNLLLLLYEEISEF
jgi:DNA-binding transcriptional ArsR family regulator